MQLRCITDQNRKEMLSALVWLCILTVVHGWGCLHVYRQKKTFIKTCTHTLRDYCDVLSVLGKVE